MTWENILKATLPSKQEAGTFVDNEARRKMDEWAMAYERDVVNQLQVLARERPNFGYLRFSGNQVELTGIKEKMDYAQMANLMKGFVRAVAHGTYKGNYGQEIARLAEMPNNIASTLQSNSSYIVEFERYVKKVR